MNNTQKRNPIVRFIEILEDSLVVLLFAATASISLLQIILRNFFDSGISWATPMLGVLLLWLTLSGAVVAVRKDRHISINILAQNFSPPIMCLTYAITKLFTTIVCAAVAYYGALFVHMDYEQGGTLFADLPAWACELIIPVSFALLSIRYLISAIEEIQQLKQMKTS